LRAASLLTHDSTRAHVRHIQRFTFKFTDIHIHTWLDDSHMAEDACEDGGRGLTHG
jgi:hypothetical protein